LLGDECVSSALLLALLLAASPPGPGRDPRTELDATAVRIERLKARQLSGEDVHRELEALLVRAQELAARIEATLELNAPVPVAPVPTSDDLRERADAARDDADRLASVAQSIEARMAAIRREPRDLRNIAIGAPPPEMDRERRLHALALERAHVLHRMHAALREASRLDAEASAIETDRKRR
jgi:hypothetical protein